MFFPAKYVFTILFSLLTEINAAPTQQGQQCLIEPPPAGIALLTTTSCCEYYAPTSPLETCAELEGLHGLTLAQLTALNPSLLPTSLLLSEAGCTAILQAAIDVVVVSMGLFKYPAYVPPRDIQYHLLTHV
jgi:hypothetical protein